MTDMSAEEIDEIRFGHCCDCGHRGFVGGPQAVHLNYNVECGNLDCRARFNVVYYAGMVQTAQRIPKRSEGGPEWITEPRKRKKKKH